MANIAKDRAAAAAALRVYYPEPTGNGNDADIMDLIVDLMHLADSLGEDAVMLHEGALDNYLDETECQGHESLAGEHMGETVYCDGSCR